MQLLRFPEAQTHLWSLTSEFQGTGTRHGIKAEPHLRTGNLTAVAREPEPGLATTFRKSPHAPHFMTFRVDSGTRPMLLMRMEHLDLVLINSQNRNYGGYSEIAHLSQRHT